MPGQIRAITPVAGRQCTSLDAEGVRCTADAAFQRVLDHYRGAPILLCQAHAFPAPAGE